MELNKLQELQELQKLQDVLKSFKLNSVYEKLVLKNISSLDHLNFLAEDDLNDICKQLNKLEQKRFNEKFRVSL